MTKTVYTHYLQKITISAISMIFAVALLSSGTGLQAQEPSPADEKGPTSLTAAAAMQVFLEDRETAEVLSPLASTPCIAGNAGSYPCNNVDLLAFMPLNTIGGGESNDIWGWTDPQNGKEYALIGLTSGTSFVDISDPENPVYLGKLPTHTSNSSWRDIKVYSNHAFIVSEASGHGIQVFDLTRLRTVVAPPVTFTEDAHYDGIGKAHNIVINEETAYAYAVGSANGTQSGCSGGLHMVDISTPTSPTFAGCFSSDGYTHDAQCVIYNGPDLDHIGKEICFNGNEDTVTIVDVTDKSNPTQLARMGYVGSEFTHQTWLSEDQSILFVNDEQDEQKNGHNTRTYIWDVSDLDALGAPAIHDSSAPAIDHNMYIKGNLMYQANYRAGLRILDVSEAANGNLSEVGYFDVYPASDSASFNGAWSNYPYFDSDNVIISGIEQGLFIVQPNMTPDFRMAPAEVSLDICDAGNDSTTLNLESLYGYNNAVTMSIAGVPAGVSGAFSTNPITPDGSTNLTITNTGASVGSYLLTVTGTDGSITVDEYLKLTIAGTVAPPTLISPVNGATDVSTSPILSWTDPAGATSYDIEVATDAAFNNIVDTATGVFANHYAPSLNPNTQYYWRVRSNNGCFTSAYSAPFNFTTGDAPTSVCRTPDLLIPDNNPSGIDDVMVAANTNLISDLDISLNVTHSWVGDLKFTLTHNDSGTTVTFIDRPGIPGSTSGCSNNNIVTTIDDEGADGSVETTCDVDPALSGNLTPAPDALSAFDGESLAGTWTLNVSDHVSQDSGSVVEWCLNASVCETPSAVIDVMIGRSDNNVTLAWTDIGADYYDIWRSRNEPYFTPGPDCGASADCTTVTTNNHIATGDIGSADPNYSYLIVARENCGSVADPSNVTAEFDFGLSPGAP